MVRPGEIVLIVDDDDDIRESLRDLLEGEGYAVATADNGKEALESLRRGLLPCLIILDLMMPVMDGWQFRTEQQSDPQLAMIPVVVITAARDTRVDAVEILPKPLHPDSILGTIARYC